MSEPANAIPITTSVRESYPLIIGKLNDYQQQIDEATQSYQQQIDDIELMPGPSAYDSAVAGGFTGTEAEWIASLEGDPGPQGEQGPPGEDGTDGTGLTQAQADKLAALGMTTTLRLSADTSIPNTTWTPVVWGVETQDPGNWHSSTNPERITPPAGVYSVSGFIRWNASTTGIRQYRLWRYDSAGNSNLLGIVNRNVTADPYAGEPIAYGAVMNAGDYLVLDVRQDSGAALSFRSAEMYLHVTRIG